MSISLLYAIFYCITFTVALATIVHSCHRTNRIGVVLTITLASTITAMVVMVYVVPRMVPFTIEYTNTIALLYGHATAYVGSIGVTLIFSALVLAFAIDWSPTIDITFDDDDGDDTFSGDDHLYRDVPEGMTCIGTTTDEDGHIVPAWGCSDCASSCSGICASCYADPANWDEKCVGCDEWKHACDPYTCAQMVTTPECYEAEECKDNDIIDLLASAHSLSIDCHKKDKAVIACAAIDEKHIWLIYGGTEAYEGEWDYANTAVFYYGSEAGAWRLGMDLRDDEACPLDSVEVHFYTQKVKSNSVRNKSNQIIPDEECDGLEMWEVNTFTI